MNGSKTILLIEDDQAVARSLKEGLERDGQDLGSGDGADDYMTKPYSLRKLLSRVRAMLRLVNSL